VSGAEDQVVTLSANQASDCIAYLLPPPDAVVDPDTRDRLHGTLRAVLGRGGWFRAHEVVAVVFELCGVGLDPADVAAALARAAGTPR
jgi:hypothetical protein